MFRSDIKSPSPKHGGINQPKHTGIQASEQRIGR